MLEKLFKRKINEPNSNWINSEINKEIRKLLTKYVFNPSTYEIKIYPINNSSTNKLKIEVNTNKPFIKNSKEILIYILLKHTSEVEIGLKINVKDKKLLKNKIKRIYSIIKNNYELPNLHFKNDKIITHNLKLFELGDNSIEKSLYEIFEIYNFLIIRYPEILKNKIIEINNLRKTLNPKIWTINLNKNKESTIQYWIEFKNNSYITLSYIYEHNNINYNLFNNAESIKSHIADNNKGKKLSNSIWTFVNNILKNDIIIVYDSDGLKGIGIISSNFISNNKEIELNNFYYVNWITHIDNIKFDYGKKKNDIIEISQIQLNEIILRLSNYSESLLTKIINHILVSFNEFKRKSNLLEDYQNKTELITTKWVELQNKKLNEQDISNQIWDELLQPFSKKPIKSIIKNRENFSEEELKIVSNLFFDTINKLILENDSEKQKIILENYNNNKYSSKLKSFEYFNIIHFLKNDFILIDKNIETSIKFFNKIFGINFKLNKSLINYIDTNNSLHELLNAVAKNTYLENFKFNEFNNFYEFSNYLRIYKNKPLPILILKDIRDYSNPKLDINLYNFYKNTSTNLNQNNIILNVLNEIKKGNEEILENTHETISTVKNIESKLETLNEQITQYQISTENELENVNTDYEMDLIIESHLNKCVSKIIEHHTNIKETDYYCIEKTKIINSLGKSAWNKLSEKSKTFLITSKVMYNKLIITPGIIDYSGVCLLITKALEVEIFNRFFINFISYLDSTYNQDYNKYPTPLLFKNKKPFDSEKFSLGRVAYILCYKENKYDTDKQKRNNKLKLMEYCKSNIFSKNSSEEIEKLLTKYAESIENIRVKYRNPSAHTNQLQHKDAEECFNLILDVEKLLKKMLDSFDQ